MKSRCSCLMCRFGCQQHCERLIVTAPLTAEDIRLALLTSEQLVSEVDEQIRQQLKGAKQ